MAHLIDDTSGRRDLAELGDELAKKGAYDAARAAYEEAALAGGERVDGELCLKIARMAVEAEEFDSAIRWLRALVDYDGRFRTWHSGARVLETIPTEQVRSAMARTARVGVLSSYTTAQLVPMLRLAGLRANVHVITFEGGYDQYQQQVIDAKSPIYEFAPDFVVLAVHEGALRLPSFSEMPASDVNAEVIRLLSLWRLLRERTGARVVQHTLAVRPETPFGHLTARLPGSRHAMVHAVNGRLGESAGDDVLLVDCERLAAAFGKRRWFDDRYWHLAKQAVALDALPFLALHTLSVVAGDLGLAKKCLALDLDNTLWGGIVAEDGVAGLTLGDGPEGEAYLAFQHAVLELKQRGVILAVCSKNNEADALAVFEEHPSTRLRRDDFAAFVANWEPKPDNLQRVARELGIGLDSIVYCDDNPAERELVRRSLPEVDVLALPPDPALYARALFEYPFFESSSYSAEDARRTEQYRGRQQAAELASSAVDMDSFLRELQMHAVVAPFDELHLPRIVQLIAKTNQFNLTTRRHGLEQVQAFVVDPGCVHLYLKLRDRFADHGLVAVAIGLKRGEALVIDTFLMSCRVIARTVEATLASRLCEEAAQLGCTKLVGTYVPTEKNGFVQEAFGALGFSLIAEEDGRGTWEYDLAKLGPISNEFIVIDDVVA